MITLFLLFFSLTCSGIEHSLSPKALKTGQVVLLQFTPPQKAEDLEIKEGDKKLLPWNCESRRCALVPIDIDSKEGERVVAFSWKGGNDSVSFNVAAGKFSVSKLKVDPDKVHPSEEEQKRINLEKKEIDEAFEHPSEVPLWKGPFTKPLKAGITSSFGNRRVFNGDLKSIHKGLDLRAAPKTPLHASNDGKVILAKEFFYAGNFVAVDHGMGIYTTYAHLSAFEVKQGQTVKKGELLGYSGATGRVTGPHAHWGVRVLGVSVDPSQFCLLSKQIP